MKGKELELLDQNTFFDKEGHERKAIRVKWWESPEDHTYDSITAGKIEGLPNLPIRNGGVFQRFGIWKG